jgi:hypothetical protein
MKETANETFPPRDAKPFRMQRRTNYAIPAEVLIADEANRQTNFEDILGAGYFQARNDVLAEYRALLTDVAYRAKLGTIKGQKIDEIAQLDLKSQDLALRLAEMSMDRLIERIDSELTGSIRDYPAGYWIEFERKAVLYKILGFNANGPKLKKVLTHVLDSSVSIKKQIRSMAKSIWSIGIAFCLIRPIVFSSL